MLRLELITTTKTLTPATLLIILELYFYTILLVLYYIILNYIRLSFPPPL